MSHRGILRGLAGCLLAGLAWGLLPASPASAIDLLGWLKGADTSHTAEFLGDAPPKATAPIIVTTPPSGPIRGTARPSVAGTPSFAWGYFGAAPRPVRFAHDGYCDDESWWAQKRR